MVILDAELDSEYNDQYIVALPGANNAESANVVVTTYIENNAQRLRERYLTFIGQLGESVINGENLVSLLEFENGNSLWWLTLLAEQNPWKSPLIIDVLAIFALEEIVGDKRPEQVIYAGNNSALFSVLTELSREMNIPISWHKKGVSKSVRGLKWRRMFHILHAIYFLFKQALQKILSGSFKLPYPATDDSSILICNYLDQVDKKKCLEIGMRSPYWGNLDNLLKINGIKAHWLHLYVPSNSFSSPGMAKKYLDKLNQKFQNKENHSLLLSYLNFRIFFQVLLSYIKLLNISFKLGKPSVAFRPGNSKYSLFPILSQDWNSSLYGACAINSLLLIALFNKAISSLKNVNKCIYLLENQAWERALLYAWRKHRDGRIIGVQHSMVRFWDLRYFTCKRPKNTPVPTPDLTLVNGKLAMAAMVNAGFAEEELEMAEALRYENLEKIHTDKGVSEKADNISVLVVGDYLENYMDLMAATLGSISVDVRKRFSLVIKPHPNFPIGGDRYDQFEYRVDYSPLDEVLDKYSVCIASNLTSASVDAVLAGIPVIIISEKNQLNFSPLRDYNGVTFTYTTEELEKALIRIIDGIGIPQSVNTDIFYLDSSFPKWNSLLSSS